MTKTFALALFALATAHAAMAQSLVVPRPAQTPAPLPAPAAAPFAATEPFLFPEPAPLPPAPPSPMTAPTPPAPPMVFAESALPPEPPQAPFVPPPPAPAVPAPPAPVVFDDFPFDFQALRDLEQSLDDLEVTLTDQKFELKAQAKGPYVSAQVPQPAPFVRAGGEERSYDQARQLIERDQYDRALPVLDSVIQAKGKRADAAMYWKAYSLSKLARRPEALTVLAELQKEFPNGAWVRDARALEVEIRQASGQSVSTDMPDDEVKVLALRGVMQSDPDAAVPVIERMLQGNSSVRVKDRALFVLSQNRSTRARDIITNVATSASNPELRLSAVRYLGMRQDPESSKLLADLYSKQTDADVKRVILRSLGAANARDRLLAIAKGEKDPELRGIAILQLGGLRGSAELEDLYRSESDKDVKRRILQSFVAANASDKLAAIARTEKDPDLQRIAIRNLGTSNRPEALEALRTIYQSPDSSIETRKAVIEALAIHQNCSGLVALARTEKSKELQTEIVRRLSTQTNRCSEARDYMLELLK